MSNFSKIRVTDRRAGNGRTAAVPVSAKFWRAFRADYLRLEKPTAKAAYDRVCDWAEQNDVAIPPMHLIYKKIAALPRREIVAARDGLAALDALYPSQRRSVRGLAPLERVNGDGWPLDIFVRPPDNSDDTPRPVCRPRLWCWQDVASRKIVGWKLAETESAELLLSSLVNVFADAGVPQHLHLDNTRAVSAVWLSGGGRRFARKDGEEKLCGVLGEIGIRVHHTALIDTAGKTAGGNVRRRGRGRSKPVERVFRILADRVAKHPAFSGRYTGASPVAKPENYDEGREGAPWAEVEQVIGAEIARLNAAKNRRAVGLQDGESANDAFARICKTRAPRMPSARDFDAVLSPAETTKIANDGTFYLRAGAAAGFGVNRYHAEELLEYKDKRMLVRYDPCDLHAPVIVLDARGRRVCRAVCLLAAGFGDAAAAKEHNRALREWKRKTISALAAERKVNEAQLREIARANMPDIPAAAAAQIARAQKTGTDNKPAAPQPRRLREAWDKFLSTNEGDL